MPVYKQRDSFKAVLKSGREYVASRCFPTKREAQAWLAREKAALEGGVDPRAGRVTVRDLLPEWLEVRRQSKAAKTVRTDRELLRLLSPALGSLDVNRVQGRDVHKWFLYLRRTGQSHSSIKRYRASLSSFFAWCVEEKRVSANPVEGTKLPSNTEPPHAMRPFSEGELEEVWQHCRELSPTLADLVLVAGWTGLRWGELRALRVCDVIEVPSPALFVSRSMTEGGQVKATKSYESRRVPLASRVLPIVRAARADRAPHEPLFTGERGGHLWRSSLIRTLRWETTGHGRRIHDLRHTAACLWLARGVDAGTVQAWMGHESISTTNRYLHHLGSASDMAALELLNRDREHSGGTRTNGPNDSSPRFPL